MEHDKKQRILDIIHYRKHCTDGIVFDEIEAEWA